MTLCLDFRVFFSGGGGEDEGREEKKESQNRPLQQRL